MEILTQSTSPAPDSQAETIQKGTSEGNLGADAPSSLLAQLRAAAEVVETAVACGVGEPDCVTVSEHGCSAILDTAALLGWGALFTPRPTVTTYAESPFVMLSGLIDGQPWRATNGQPEPALADQRPWSALDTARGLGQAPESAPEPAEPDDERPAAEVAPAAEEAQA